MKSLLTSLATLCMCALLNAHAHQTTAIQALADKANALIASLDVGQKSSIRMTLDNPDRMDWHYIPKERKGLALRDMSPDQQALSMAFISELMSHSGMQKVEGVITSETILWLGSDKSERRNPGNYHFTVFGKPGTKTTWGASVEGHHLSLNLTIVGGQKVSVTPSFMGSNPDRSEDGHQPLSAEMHRAEDLFNSLDEKQRRMAVMDGKTPREILTSSDRKVSALPGGGLPVSGMHQQQVNLLRQLIGEYIDRYRQSFAESDWKKIEAAGFEKVTFLWSRTAEPNKALYYRIQGPTFVIEYANAQNHGNHSHTVWRDFENDFGYDDLREHMAAGH